MNEAIDKPENCKDNVGGPGEKRYPLNIFIYPNLQELGHGHNGRKKRYTVNKIVHAKGFLMIFFMSGVMSQSKRRH